MKLTDRKKMSFYDVAASWLAGLMLVSVWGINQPLWSCVGITAISLIIPPLMVAMLWTMDENDKGENDKGR